MATMAENVFAADSENQRESMLYDEFDNFTSEPGESIHLYYLRYAKLINDMNMIPMSISPMQINTKFVNHLQPEWSRFVTAAKQARNLHKVNFDQLTHSTIQNGQVTVENVQGRQSQGYVGNAGKNQATWARVVNTVGNGRVNQPRVIRCYNCRAGVPLNDEQHDFLADTLEETDDCEDLQLQATTNFKADHGNAYDLDCHDEATTNAIFMASLCPVGSINDDMVEPCYDSDILSESYDELMSNNNVISYADYMLTIGNDADNYVPPPIQNNDMILSVIDQMKSQVERCNTFLRTKDEAQVSRKATLRYLCIDNGTKFINQTLQNYTEEIGITHNTSTTPIAIACYTQNRSLIHTRYNKSPYELLRDRKPELKYLHTFGALCYPINDFEDLGKLLPKVDIGIFIGYSPSKKAYRIYNKMTRLIMETMNVQFDELTQMASEQHGPGPERQGLTSGHISSGLVLNQAASTSDTARASPSSTSIDKDAPSPSISPNNETTSLLIKSTNVKEPHNEEYVEFDSDTLTNPFAPPVNSSAESSSRIVNTSNMHTFQQPQINTKQWTKDHPLVTIIGNLSESILTRCQLATNAIWCYFHAFLVKEEPKI
ncbi:retrovirus-related pol polyprotein from transposon TNT 1-94 [Tanacetum coccineum]